MTVSINHFALALGALIALLVAAEIGFRLGLWQHKLSDDVADAAVGTMEISLLGLL